MILIENGKLKSFGFRYAITDDGNEQRRIKKWVSGDVAGF
jgi:hypothetical protein